jgi:hypothetical protein
MGRSTSSVRSTGEENSRLVYHNEMSDEEHRELTRLLQTGQAKIVVSGYPSPLYEELHAGWRLVSFGIANHAAGGERDMAPPPTVQAMTLPGLALSGGWSARRARCGPWFLRSSMLA